ncbi:glycosyltransferase [Schlegelella sp. S2-27]|uniref:Glycosyltransferase n=1 Tax=Caldimonas mangrovi TaxID=2944811 RepID=A0ABT0YNM1_9BURK|nr:glycosyltransferase [Caldimonas mangrovi]MCM5680333.1 glycosyltransferase [Caldimonas mangrovi]
MDKSVASVLMVLESVFPTKGGGGAESQVRTLGRHMRARHLEVSVVVPMVSYGPQLACDSVDGITVRRITYPKLPLLGAASMLFKLGWLLYARRREYSVIHAHIAGNMAAVSCLMGRLLGKTVVVKLTGMTEMLGGILDPRPSWLNRLKRLALRGADHYQATSSRIGRMLVESGFDAGKVRLIPNAVDTDRFASVERDAAVRRELCGERPLIGVYVGRLVPEKGLELLLDGWARVFRERSDAALILVGDGVLRDALVQRAQGLGIADQVHFTGPSDAVEGYLALADFGVLTSLSEGLSNTLLEYMAAGLPVVGSRVSGTEDFVRPGETGWLFEPGDVGDFEHSLRAAAEAGPPVLDRMGTNARGLVVSRASIGSVVQQLAALYGVPQIA